MTDTHPFDQVRITFFMLIWLVYPFFMFGVDAVLIFIDESAPWYVWQLTYIYFLQGVFLAAIAVTARLPVELPLAPLFGRDATGPEIRSMVVLSIYLFLTAIAFAYVFFLPLSYWVPAFVEYWYINSPDIVYRTDHGYPLLPNLLSLISLCVLAPLIEEFAFRCVILHRLARLISLRWAIFWSSLAFGIVHADPLGATFFGIVMCILYLRTQSLWVPILCHGIYNLGVWLISLGYEIGYGPDYVYTLEDFQDGWTTGLVTLVIAVIWTAVYFSRQYVHRPWRLPLQ